MKLSLLQENLNQTLAILTKAIPTKPSLPILSSIKLTADNASCSACATDLYFGVNTELAAQVEIPGTVVVPGKQFKEIISSLQAGPVTLSYSDGTLTIQSGKSKTTLQCQSADEYPPFPEVEGTQFRISTDALTSIDSLVAFAASTDVARPVLTSLLFQISNTNARIVATDGFRLAVLDLNLGITSETETQLMLPAKAIAEVARLATQRGVAEIICDVSDELKQAQFTVADVSIYVRLIDGQYPPYERIMPAESAISVGFDVEELQNHLKRAIIFARESSNIIKFSVTKEIVEISANSSLVGTYQGVLERATSSGDAIEIAFNAKYIQEYLSAVKSSQVHMEMTESLKPVTLRCAEIPGYQYVVMPFKIAS